MSSRPLIATVAAAGVLALVATVVLRERAAGKREWQLAADVAKLQAHVATLGQRTAVQERALQYQAKLVNSPTGAAEKQPGGPGAVQPPSNQPEGRMPAEKEWEEQLHSKFTAEPVAQDWSRAAADQAQGALRARLPAGSALENVECRQSFCRASASHPSVAEFRRFIEATFLARENGLWPGPFAALIVNQEPSSVASVTYFAREGKQLPQPTFVQQ
jgi:hypothetical protein